MNDDLAYKALRHLVAIDHDEVERIIRCAMAAPAQYQLVDFIHQLGVDKNTIDTILQQQDKLIPAERKLLLARYQAIVNRLPSMTPKLSLARLNPLTEFEKRPPILFGMGGGNKMLCRGLPLDVLSMVLTAEKLRRELNLGRGRIICANGITYTNIAKNADFSKEKIDRVLSAERDLLQIAVERFGFADHWDIFLETDIENIIGKDLKEQYDQMIVEADRVPFIGGHHYSIEMAQMWSLLNQEAGGVKLGWFMRNINQERPQYIMDEQPFDARYVMYLASRGITNKISIPYVKAGVRLFPNSAGHIDKDVPYICYHPKDRILLSPFENPVKKLQLATQAGGGLRSRYIRRHFATIIRLFEEMVLEKSELKMPGTKQLFYRQKTIDDDLLEDDERFTTAGNVRESKLAKRLQYLLDYTYSNNRNEAEQIYRNAFRTS